MQATLTYNLGNIREKTLHHAALHVEQLGGIIGDCIGYLSEEIEQSKNQEAIDRLTQAREYVVDLMCELGFQEVCELRNE